MIKISKLHGTGVRPVLFLENNKEVLSHKRDNKILLTVYYLSWYTKHKEEKGDHHDKVKERFKVLL